jgi:two-component system LytT family response regulator
VIRALIADDEAPSRARLRQLLASHADIEIVGEAATGIQVMDLVSKLNPGLLLLDIQMPGCNGIEVVASLPAPRPHVVFCTAFDEHAVDAFELAVVDYLLKPVSRARLSLALERVRLQNNAQMEKSIDQVVRKQRKSLNRFLVKKGDGFLVLNESRVLFFASEGSLTHLVTDVEQYLMDPTLNELEQRLDPVRFCRISRSSLINLSSVTELHPLFGGSGEVVLRNGQRLDVSRRRYRDLVQALSGYL